VLEVIWLRPSTSSLTDRLAPSGVQIELTPIELNIILSGAPIQNYQSYSEYEHYAKVCGMGCVDGVRTRKLTSAIRQNKFNIYTGEFDAGYPVVTVDTFAADDAAQPTRAVPGELTYKSSSLNPVNDVYKGKTG
jgi:hypothetical protein